MIPHNETTILKQSGRAGTMWTVSLIEAMRLTASDKCPNFKHISNRVYSFRWQSIRQCYRWTLSFGEWSN